MSYVKQLINGEVTASELGQVYVKYGGKADWKKMSPLRLANYCDELKEQELDNLIGMSGDYHDWKMLQAETCESDIDFCIADD